MSRTKISRDTAEKFRDSIRELSAKGLPVEDDQPEGTEGQEGSETIGDPEGGMDAPPQDPEAAKKDEAELKPGAESKPEGEQAAPKAGEAEDLTKAYAELQKAHKNLWRQFKAIQSSITPTQQENSAFRKELEKLRATVEELRGSGDATMTPAERAEVIARAKEIVPEAGPLFDDVERGRADVEELKARLDRQQADTIEEAKAKAVSAVLKAVPEARAISHKDSPFWTWVDAHGPRSSVAMREILSQPWLADSPQDVIDIFTGYLEEQESAAADLDPKPNPKVQLPSDIAPEARNVSRLAAEPNATGGKKLSETEWTALTRELQKGTTTRERKTEIRNLMKSHLNPGLSA